MKASMGLFMFVGGCMGVVGETRGTINNSERPQVTVADDYRAWPAFLLNVQRSDAAQVRDIYINDVGATADQGRSSPRARRW